MRTSEKIKNGLALGVAVGVLGGLAYDRSTNYAPIGPEQSPNLERIFKERAVEVGRMVLKRARQEDNPESFSQDTIVAGGTNIIVATHDGDKIYDVIVGMKKTDGKLDPSTTYEVSVEGYVNSETEVQRVTIIDVGEGKNDWYAQVETFHERDLENPTDRVDTDVNDRQLQEDIAASISEQSRLMTKLTLLLPELPPGSLEQSTGPIV
jgi:hypothetical protein